MTTEKDIVGDAGNPGDPFVLQQFETNVALDVVVAGLFGRWPDENDDSPAALAIAIGLLRVMDALEGEFAGVKEEAMRLYEPAVVRVDAPAAEFSKDDSKP